MGDSFTRGFPVLSSQNYPAHLEQILEEGGFPVNVINTGLGDSGPDCHLRLLVDYLLPRVNPSIVIWTFYPNDIRDNVITSTYALHDRQLVRQDGSRHWLARRYRFFHAIPLPASDKRESYLFRLFLRAIESVGVWLTVPPELRDEMWNWSFHFVLRKRRQAAPPPSGCRPEVANLTSPA